MRSSIYLVVCTMLSTTALASPPKNVSELATSLSSLRGTCSTMASDAYSAFDMANLKARLDRQLAEQKAEQDTELYSIGHGQHEATEFALNRAQQDAKTESDRQQQIADKMQADSAKVKACVKDAEAKGKAIYVAYKKKHRHAMKGAESLMTAWLTNVDEISFNQPQGSKETGAAWKTAKARAEISSM